MFEAPPLFGLRGAGLYFPFRIYEENRRSRFFIGVFEGRTPERGWTEEEFLERMSSRSLDPWPEERSALEREYAAAMDEAAGRLLRKH